MSVLPNGFDVLMNNAPQRFINAMDPFAVAGRLQPMPALVGITQWENGGYPIPKTATVANTFNHSGALVTTDAFFPDEDEPTRLYFRSGMSYLGHSALQRYAGFTPGSIEPSLARHRSYDLTTGAIPVIGGNLDDGDGSIPYILTPDGTKHYVSLDEREGEIRGIDTVSLRTDGYQEEESINLGESGEVQSVTVRCRSSCGNFAGASRRSYEYAEVAGMGLALRRMVVQKDPKALVPALYDDQKYTFNYDAEPGGNLTVVAERTIGKEIVRDRETRTYTPNGLLIHARGFMRNNAGLTRNVHELVVAPAYWSEGPVSVAALYSQITSRVAA